MMFPNMTSNYLYFQGNCRDTANQKHAEGDEKFQPDSRCFVANLTKEVIIIMKFMISLMFESIKVFVNITL